MKLGARAGDADAAAGPYCQTVTPKPAFCDDFDQDQSSIWKAKYVDDGGTLGLDPTAFVSPPSSLRSTMLTSATCQYASYSRDFTLTFASRFRLAFDLAVGHLAGDAGFVDGVAINEISLAGPGDNGRCGYYFSVSPGAASLAIETSGTGRIELSPFIPTAKWTHVELVVDKATSTAQVSIDGVDAGAGAIPSACQLGEVGTLDVGILCAQPGVDFDVHEDNLAMWTE